MHSFCNNFNSHTSYHLFGHKLIHLHLRVTHILCGNDFYYKKNINNTILAMHKNTVLLFLFSAAD